MSVFSLWSYLHLHNSIALRYYALVTGHSYILRFHCDSPTRWHLFHEISRITHAVSAHNSQRIESLRAVSDYSTDMIGRRQTIYRYWSVCCVILKIYTVTCLHIVSKPRLLVCVLCWNSLFWLWQFKVVFDFWTAPLFDTMIDFVTTPMDLLLWRIFNTNNLWVSLEAMNTVVEQHNLHLEIIVNPKVQLQFQFTACRHTIEILKNMRSTLRTNCEEWLFFLNCAYSYRICNIERKTWFCLFYFVRRHA